ncbi:hypothetical protein HanPI659440_Chr16g0631351 [Helianthus annuus]|nr:hypothetical protein HanPI659440_Chr16g0631351 [Helianthus annuus]KAJ0712962.1 hypothetical protein HanOQP8_Chr09g0340551 [Helianthus annuus]
MVMLTCFFCLFLCRFGDKRELLHRDIDDLLVIIMPILSISVFEVGPKSRTC